MNRTSLLLYIFVTAVNIFLFLPVFFYPIVFIPLHIFLYILSFNWLFRQKTFKSTWNKLTFSGIPVIGQIVLTLTYLLSDSDSQVGILSLLDNLIILILFLVVLIEFGILATLYSKYLAKKHIA